MDIDPDKIDEAVLALLYLTLHDDSRAWKGFDWESLNRLHQKGLILDPPPKESLVLSFSLINKSRHQRDIWK